MTSVFLSYAHEDSPIADALSSLLSDAGIEVLTSAKILPGEIFSSVIEDRLHRADGVAFLVSPAFPKSEWTGIETAMALAAVASGQPKHLLPILIGDVDPVRDVPRLLARYQWLDLRDGVTRAAVDSLVHSLRRPRAEADFEAQLTAEERVLALREAEQDYERRAYEVTYRSRRQAQQMVLSAILGILTAALAVASTGILVLDDDSPGVVLVGTIGAALGATATALWGWVRSATRRRERP